MAEDEAAVGEDEAAGEEDEFEDGEALGVWRQGGTHCQYADEVAAKAHTARFARVEREEVDLTERERLHHCERRVRVSSRILRHQSRFRGLSKRNGTSFSAGSDCKDYDGRNPHHCAGFSRGTVFERRSLSASLLEEDVCQAAFERGCF